MRTLILTTPPVGAVVVDEDSFVIDGFARPFRYVVSVVPAFDDPELRFYQLFHCGLLVFSAVNLSSLLRYVSGLSICATVS